MLTEVRHNLHERLDFPHKIRFRLSADYLSELESSLQSKFYLLFVNRNVVLKVYVRCKISISGYEWERLLAL